MDLKGTRTEKNLQEAFAGESMARNKYTYFSGAAKKEGYEQISGIFAETAQNEAEHAKMWFRALGGLCEGKTPGDTRKNLLAAAEGEHYEWTEMYKEFERVAREEGFDKIADSFHEVAEVEAEHEKRYRKLVENLEKEIVFKRDVVVRWKCRNCGYIHEGYEAPLVCPACKHPRSYFEIADENY